MTSEQKKVRHACGTLNNFTEDNLEKLRIFMMEDCTYGVYGKEVGAQGTPHLQFYFEKKTQMTYTAINKKLGCKRGATWADLEIRRGTPKQAAGYCKKGDTEECEDYAIFYENASPTWTGEEWGVISNQGERVDLKRKIDAIISGETTPDDVCVDFPVFYHQYGRTLEKAWAIGMRKKWRTEMTTCEWIWGPTGVGKSHTAFTNYSPDTHYVWNTREEFQCGYRQQDIVIINEFRGQIKYHDLLEMIDKWPWSVTRKGGEKLPFISKHVIITSCKPPEEVYPRQDEKDSLLQLMDRIDVTYVSGTSKRNK